MSLELELHAVRSDLEAALTKLDNLIAQSAKRVDTEDADTVQRMPRTRAIEWVLQQRGGDSMRPVEVWAELRRLGRDDPKSEVQVTIYDLWERARIGKSGRGLYHAKEGAT